MEYNELAVQQAVIQWLAEDIGSGDVTTNSIVPADGVIRAVIHAKEAGVIAGLPLAALVFGQLSPGIALDYKVKDGDRVEPGTVLIEVAGSARAILTGERLALNLLQRLSGIATKTALFVEKVKPYPARIVDTRKTVPGLRLLEKYAVRAGGGSNHRFGLFDAVLIKDNHIKVAGGIAQAIIAARSNVPHTVKIEVEVETLSGVAEALAAKADIIMLDNMTLNDMCQAVQLVAGRALTEASGGVNEETVAGIAAAGVDVISVGALTHSVKALDISLDIGEIKRKSQ